MHRGVPPSCFFCEALWPDGLGLLGGRSGPHGGPAFVAPWCAPPSSCAFLVFPGPLPCFFQTHKSSLTAQERPMKASMTGLQALQAALEAAKMALYCV